MERKEKEKKRARFRLVETRINKGGCLRLKGANRSHCLIKDATDSDRRTHPRRHIRRNHSLRAYRDLREEIKCRRDNVMKITIIIKLRLE